MAAAGVDGLLVTHLPDVPASVRVYRVVCGAGAGAGGATAVYRWEIYRSGEGRGQGNAGGDCEEACGDVAACEWMETAGSDGVGSMRRSTTVAALESMRKAVSARVRRGMFVAGGVAGCPAA